MLFDARPIFTALQVGKEVGRIHVTEPADARLSELALHLATRSQMLMRCLRYLDDALVTAIKSAIPVGEDQGCSRLDDTDIYSLLLFIDCFLFESYAYMEVLEKLVKCVLVEALGVSRDNARRAFAKIRDQSGRVGQKTWNGFLSDVRNHFSHAATPWIAIDRTRRAEGVYDVVVMRENIVDFAGADPRKYFFAVKDLNAAWEGLMNTAGNFQEYILDKLRSQPRGR